MRCVKIKGPKKFEVSQIPEPLADGENVIIDIKKSGICGSDLHYWIAGEPKGLIMGHEFCGVVKNPGNREDLIAGDRVTALPISPCGHCEPCKSGNVQYCAKTWDKSIGLALTNPGALTQTIAVRSDMVMKVPATISDEEVAVVEPTAVGLHAIHLADIKVGDKVLVIGGGIIGQISAMFAKMEGASYVVVSETNPKRGEKALKLGVADGFADARDPKMIEKYNIITEGGFDVVIECCGNSPAVSSAIMAVKPGGTVILVGVSLGTVTIPSIVAVTRELNIKGAIAYTIDEFKTCIELMAQKRIDTLKFVDDIVDLESTQEAYERLTSGKDDAIKIIVDPNK